MQQFDLVVSQADILGGKPCIKGTRISIDLLLEWFASGATIAGLIEQYPHLTEEGIRQGLQYAAKIIQSERFFEIKLPHEAA